ncbi:MAG: glycosyltransferase [Bacteroidaceae bacterium]|nr:glycosyltransferase [Bacteroidaceae bacterium]
MKPLNIVIIGQWIPPTQTPRSHRTWQLATKFAKMGHNVTVYALLGKTDYSEYEKKYGIKIKNIGKSYFGCIDSDNTPIGIINRGIKRLLGKRFQYPQIELKYMVKRLIKSINEDVDILFTIASPHTIHWGAAEAMPKQNIKYWIADCGDPFMLNPFHYSPSYFEKFERNWCNKCDAIAIPIEEGREAYYKEYHDKIHIIPQGFDFSEAELAEYKPNKVPTFAFAGIVYPGMRDPSNFLKHLLTLNYQFKFIVYTKYKKHFEPYATQLGEKVEFRDYVPRNELIHELSKMDFLINIENIGSVQQPSKLIDYGQANRPVLSITSEFNTEESGTFNQFINKDYSNALKINNLERFDIHNICNQFINLYKR